MSGRTPRGSAAEKTRCPGADSQARAAPVYPRAATASATASAVTKSDSSARLSSAANVFAAPRHPSASQSIPRAASPSEMLRTSSNTMEKRSFRAAA